jgi:hypothetical protein
MNGFLAESGMMVSQKVVTPVQTEVQGLYN